MNRTPEQREAERKARHAKWKAMLTDRDWARLAEAAETITDGKVSACLDDLDAPLRVGLCELGWETRFSGERIGELRGFAVVVWEKG